MIHVDRVLCPTDGSACAERARRRAFHVADRFDAAVHVIHVDEREVDLADVIDIHESDVLEDLHAPIDWDEDKRSTSPTAIERRVVHPSAPEGILSYATECDVSLIVLGTHGRRGVRRAVLGSVAEEVVRRATCPVITVGRGAHPPEAMHGGDILVPIDFSEYQVRLLAHAREIARAYDMTMTLLHVVEIQGLPGVYDVFSGSPEPSTIARRTETVLEQRADELRAAGLDVNVEVRTGHVAAQTLAVADELDVEFLAIATHGRSGVERMLIGSVAENVLRRAACPVFTVKAFGKSLVGDANGVNGS